MKLQADNIVKNQFIKNDPTAVEQVKIVLSTVLNKAIQNKIDWNAQAINSKEIKYSASVHVMNNAEWNAAKEILKSLMEKHPNTEGDIRRVLGIIDPLGTF